MFDFKSRRKLDNPDRRRLFPPKETLEKLGLVEGMDMADIGAGIGYFSLPGSEIIGGGNLYALDISEDMLNFMDTRIKEADIKNIDTVVTEEYNLKIGSKTVDFVLMVNVLHEILDKNRFIDEIKRISREGAYLSIIDFKKKRVNEEGPPENVRISLEESEKLLVESGYTIEESFDFSESFYGLRAILI